MVKYEIFNETKIVINEIEDLKKVLDYAIKKEKINNSEFNIIFVDNKTIKKLNKNYRNIDLETDVISFALLDDFNINIDYKLLGDIYISIDKAYTQALIFNHSKTREVCFLAIHGLLHLLGYNHLTKEDKTIMRNKEEAILNGTIEKNKTKRD